MRLATLPRKTTKSRQTRQARQARRERWPLSCLNPVAGGLSSIDGVRFTKAGVVMQGLRHSLLAALLPVALALAAPGPAFAQGSGLAPGQVSGAQLQSWLDADGFVIASSPASA